MELSVIIPVYNQEENIEKNLTALKSCLSDQFKAFEIIAVNDGSTDNSLEILKSISFIRLISYSENRGKGYAVKRGVMAAQGKYIFFTDADLSYSPENFRPAVEVLKTEHTNGIIGIRSYKKSDYPPHRRLLSNAFSFFVKRLLKLNTKDSQCGFKGFEKTCARNIFSSLTVFRFGFDAELLLEAQNERLKLSSLPVHFTHFEASSVKPLKDSREMLFSLLKLKFRRRRLEKYRNKK